MEALDAISKSADTLGGWALAIFGGSILTVLSTSYSRPDSLRVRLLYFLFLPAWGLLGWSMYHGHATTRRVIVAKMDANKIGVLAEKINKHYIDQQDYLTYALVFLVAWLVIYLGWWIFHSEGHEK